MVLPTLNYVKRADGCTNRWLFGGGSVEHPLRAVAPDRASVMLQYAWLLRLRLAAFSLPPGGLLFSSGLWYVCLNDDGGPRQRPEAEARVDETMLCTICAAAGTARDDAN